MIIHPYLNSHSTPLLTTLLKNLFGSNEHWNEENLDIQGASVGSLCRIVIIIIIGVLNR